VQAQAADAMVAMTLTIAEMADADIAKLVVGPYLMSVITHE
jgi:hypothetical protein